MKTETETNNELYDIIMKYVEVFFKDGQTVEPFDKRPFAKTLSEVLDLMGYKKKNIVEKDVAKIIYGSLYKTALLFKDSELRISANDIKETAESVYGVDIVEYPYKERVTESYGNFWAVYYIHEGEICRSLFGGEHMADEFIKTLKEKENG